MFERTGGRWGGAAAAVLLALAAAGCSQPVSPGRQAYVNTGCVRCHGPALAGTAEGPPLQLLRQHWDEDSLVEYLKDPNAVMANDERLRRLAEQYPAPMPAYRMTDEDRRALAAFVLDESDK